MARTQKQGVPFPGFSIDHFNYGLQMGMDHHGNSQHPWESPYQEPIIPGRQAGGPVEPNQPYMVGENGPELMVPQQGGTIVPHPWDAPYQDPYQGGQGGFTGFDPAGQAGYSGFDPMQPNFGGYGGMAGGGQMPPGMEASPTGGDAPPQGGPSPYGVWGDQDLINDPAYAGAAGTAHPKWNRFLQYMNTPEARDSMMMGVILSQMGTDPKGALQLAVQFREHQAQRQFQAQQAEAQREAMQENIKMRSQYQMQQKEQSKFDQQATKLDAALRTAKVDPDKIIAKLGPPTPDNIEEWKTETQREVALAGEQVKKDKEEQVDFKNKAGVASQVNRTGVVPPNQYTKDGSPKFDAEYKSFLDTLASNKQGRDATFVKHQRLQDSVLNARSRILQAAKTPGEMEDRKLRFEELKDAWTLVMQAKRQMDSNQLFASAGGALKEAYNDQSRQFTERLDAYKKIAQDIRDRYGIAGDEPEPYKPEPVTAPAPQGGAPGAGAADSGTANPSQGSIDYYPVLVLSVGQEAADKEWAEAYPGVPPPKPEQ